MRRTVTPKWFRYTLGIATCAASTLSVHTTARVFAAPSESRTVTLSAAARGKSSPALLDKLLAADEQEVLIQFAATEPDKFLSGPGNRTDQLQALAAEVNTKRAAALGKHMSKLKKSRNYSHLPYTSAFVARADIADLLNDPDIVMVEPVFEVPLASSWHDQIRQPYTDRASGLNGSGKAIAILDTGVNFLHADFGTCTAAANGWQPTAAAACRVKQSLDFGDGDNFADDHGHGSNVSGIAASVAPGADIVVLDVFNWTDQNMNGVREPNEFSAPTPNLVNASNWIVSNQATYKIISANFSISSINDLDMDGLGDVDGDGIGDTGYLAGTCPASLNAAFSGLLAAGVIPVVASGNNGLAGNGVGFPACDPGAFAVGAAYDRSLGANATFNTVNAPIMNGFQTGTCTDNSPQTSDRVTCFSNSDTAVDVIAPGAGIDQGGFVMSGTSQASPHVAAAIAILAQATGVGTTAFATDLNTILSSIGATSQRATDTKWGNRKIPRLDMLDSISYASVWHNIVLNLPGTAWYATPEAKLAAGFAPVARAHRLYGTSTASYNAALLEAALRAPLIIAASF